MGLRQIQPEDFSFWRNYNRQMIDCHRKEFLQEADPLMMRAMYRGKRRNKGGDEIFQGEAITFSGNEPSRKAEDLVTLNRIFNTTNTILTNVYNQNPKKMARPTQNSSPFSAALMTAALNHYTKVNHQKEENQEAIMNAWFFGLGWKKLGYHIATESDDIGPENKLSIQDKAALGIKSILGIEPTPMEAKSTPDIVRYENLVSSSESPMNVLVDHKGDIRNHKVITHRLDRTVHDLLVSGNYDGGVLKEIEQKFRHKDGTRFDTREMDLVLNEMVIEQRNGFWILVYADEFDKPLRYEKIAHEGSSMWEPLTLTNEPGVRYPVAHMKIASGVQEWIDNVFNLQVQQLGKMRNQTIINEQAFAPGQIDALKRNKMGGIIKSKRSLQQGDVVEVTSKAIGSDQFGMLQLLQQNLTEVMGSTEQRVTGKSKNRTLGQDKIAEIGGQIRDSGMIDKIKSWMINQTRVEGQFLKQFSNSTINLQITKEDFTDPETGNSVEETWVEFMTERNPLPLRMYLEGDFEYDVNVQEAVKPDNPAIREELLAYLQIVAPFQETIIQNGGRVDILEVLEKIGDTFDTIDAKRFIERLTPEQQAAFQASAALQKGGGTLPATPQVQQPEVPA